MQRYEVFRQTMAACMPDPVSLLASRALWLSSLPVVVVSAVWMAVTVCWWGLTATDSHSYLMFVSHLHGRERSEAGWGGECSHWPTLPSLQRLLWGRTWRKQGGNIWCSLANTRLWLPWGGRRGGQTLEVGMTHSPPLDIYWTDLTGRKKTKQTSWGLNLESCLPPCDSQLRTNVDAKPPFHDTKMKQFTIITAMLYNFTQPLAL